MNNATKSKQTIQNDGKVLTSVFRCIIQVVRGHDCGCESANSQFFAKKCA